MKMISTREAQHHFAKVMEMVESGEEVVITRRGRKVARVASYHAADQEKVSIPWQNIINDLDRELERLPIFSDSTTELLRADERF
jgi:prevent-host-death family protein